MEKFLKVTGPSKAELAKIRREKRLSELTVIAKEFPWITDKKAIARIYRLRHLCIKHQNNIRLTFDEKERELHDLRLSACKTDLKQLCTKNKEIPDTRDDIDKLMHEFGY